jgi:membrane associated rhomboid family serine protease
MFFILPVGVDYRTRRYPVVTFTLIGICMLVFFVQLALRIAYGPEVDEWVWQNLGYIPSESRWWTHVTWMFIHDGFFHVAGNMIYLFLFGSCVEDWIGRPRFIALYMLTGFGSELAHVAATAEHFASEMPLGGASGAVSGCIGAFLLLFAKNRIEFKWVLFIFFRFFNGEFFLPAWLVISFWFLMDVVEMVLADAASGVAFGAHVGGTLCGIALMAVQKRFPTKLPLDEDDEDEVEATVPVVARPAVRARVRMAAAPVVLEKPALYLHLAGGQSGPFTSAQIQEMFLAGQIPADALYWQEGMENWAAADDLRPPGCLTSPT